MPTRVDEQLFQRINKRLHLKQAMQSVRNAFVKTTKAIDELDREDADEALSVHARAALIRFENDFEMWAQRVLAALPTALPQ